MSRGIALDIATVTGFAVYGGGIITSGSRDFTRYKGCNSRPADHVGTPHFYFENWLKERIRIDKPEWIAYEECGGHFKNVHASRAIFGLRGNLMAVAGGYNIPVFGYEAKKVKKFWTGSGAAKKEDMIAVARQKCPEIRLTDANEADALAVLHLHLSMAQIAA